MTAWLEEQSIINANDQFWRQMLGMELVPMANGGDFCLDGGHVVARIDLHGAWNGSIELRMDRTLAREATGAMMMVPPEALEEADVIDATQEIANMVAGVIKSSLPRPCLMTLPSSWTEIAPFQPGKAADSSIAVAFRHSSGGMLVYASEHDHASGALLKSLHVNRY